METQSCLSSFTKTWKQGTRGCIEENRGYRQWEVSSVKASLIFFNEQKAEERCNVLLHASACIGQCFFLTEPSPGRLAWDQRVMSTETESFSAVPVFRGSGPRTYKHIRQGICIQHKPQSCGKTHATSRLCAESNRRAWIELAAGCRLLPFILRPLSVMAATQRWRRKEKRGVRGGERGISAASVMTNGRWHQTPATVPMNNSLLWSRHITVSATGSYLNVDCR